LEPHSKALIKRGWELEIDNSSADFPLTDNRKQERIADDGCEMRGETGNDETSRDKL